VAESPMIARGDLMIWGNTRRAPSTK
jgi:hypothetical protein